MNTADPDLQDDGLVAFYLGHFAARHDLYVENGAEVKRETLGPEVLRKAVRHHYALSGYTATEDGRTHVGAIDFDTENGLEQALKVREVLDQNLIPCLIAASRRGAHLWVTSWDWCERGTVSRALTAAIGLALGDEAMADDKIEVFPKPGDDLACGALRLPGLTHQKDGKVYPLMFPDSAEWTPEPGPKEIVSHYQLTIPTFLHRLASSGPRRARYPKSVGTFYGFKEQREYGPSPKATEIQRDRYGVEGKPGGTARCPKHDDKRRSMTVFRDDERVYCGAPHCPFNGGGRGIGSVQLSKMQV